MESNSSIALSIKNKQRESLIRMLHFNKEDDEETNWEGDTWKVLIYDKHCSDILAPLLRIHQLREQGVTLHLLLHRDRQPIEDVPAIYFVSPTLENNQRISEDCAAKLYQSFYLNFCSTLPREIMEDLAAKTVRTETVNLIRSVYDHSLDFISLEHNLFSLNEPASLISCHHLHLTDQQAEEKVERIAERLFGVLVTMAVIPIIQCPRNGIAEYVARSVDRKLREYLLTGGSINSSYAFQRPVLVLLDRSVDFSVMLHHPWTYQAMVHDLLDSSLNRVWLDSKNAKSANNNSNNNNAANNNNKGPGKESHDLDEDLDEFWATHRSSQFPDMAAAVHTRVAELRQKKAELTKTVDEHVNGDELRKQLADTTQSLREMATSLPHIREQKRYINSHLLIATTLLGMINERDLNQYVTMEESMMCGSIPDKNALLQALKGEKGTPLDRLRLFAIYYLNAHDKQSDFDEAESFLAHESPEFFDALTFFKKTKALRSNVDISVNEKKPSTVTSTTSGFFNKVTNSLGVKDLLDNVTTMMRSQSRDSKVTKIVQSIMDMKPNPFTEKFLYFDPKIQSGHGDVPRKTTPFRESIVFMVGGGNYVEYQNLQHNTQKSQTPKNIIYGTTEILTAEQFLAQARELGAQYKSQ